MKTSLLNGLFIVASSASGKDELNSALGLANRAGNVGLSCPLMICQVLFSVCTLSANARKKVLHPKVVFNDLNDNLDFIL